MTYIYTILVVFFVSVNAQAQVGINTSQPLGVLHIDSRADGNSSAATVANDVIVDANGNLGVGTIAPTHKIHIISDDKGKGLRIKDGSEKADYVLTSDANGYGTWKMSEVSEFSLIPYQSTGNVPFNVASMTYDTGLIITFPKEGTYSVSLACFLTIAKALTVPGPVGGIPSVPNGIVDAHLQPVVAGSFFVGAAKVKGLFVQTVNANTPTSPFKYVAYINQNMEVNATTGLQAKLIFTLSGMTATAGSVKAEWGDGNNGTGGTFIRVK